MSKVSERAPPCMRTIGLLLFVVGAILACTSGFPEQEEATDLFLEYQADFERLLQLRAESGLETVLYRNSVDQLIGYRLDGIQRELQGDLNSEFVSLLKKLAIRRVTYHPQSTSTLFVPSGHAVSADPRMFVEYLHQRGDIDAPTCDESDLDDKAGACVVSISPDWWLYYSWSD